MPFKARRSGNYASPCWFISRSFHWQRTRPESSNIYSQLLYTYNVCLCAYVAKIVDLSSARIAFRLQFHFVNTFLELVVTQTLKGNDDNDNYRCRLCSESAITSAMSSDLNRERSGSPNRINSYADPDICRITSKLLRIHYLIGVSHFTECRENRPVTVREC